MKKFHIAYKEKGSGDWMHKCCGSTYYSGNIKYCGNVPCNSPVLRLYHTLHNVRGRAFFVGVDLLNSLAWNDNREGYTLGQIEGEIDAIIAELDGWKNALRKEVEQELENWV